MERSLENSRTLKLECSRQSHTFLVASHPPSLSCVAFYPFLSYLLTPSFAPITSSYCGFAAWFPCSWFAIVFPMRVCFGNRHCVPLVFVSSHGHLLLRSQQIRVSNALSCGEPVMNHSSSLFFVLWSGEVLRRDRRLCDTIAVLVVAVPLVRKDSVWRFRSSRSR